MRISEIDEPLALDGPFLDDACLAEAIFLWFFKPAHGTTHGGTGIISVLLFLLLAAIAAYSVIMFIVSLLHNFRSQAQRLAFFVFAIVVSGVVLAYVWVSSGFRAVPDSAAVVAGLFANCLFCLFEPTVSR